MKAENGLGLKYFGDLERYHEPNGPLFFVFFFFFNVIL